MDAAALIAELKGILQQSMADTLMSKKELTPEQTKRTIAQSTQV